MSDERRASDRHIEVTVGSTDVVERVLRQRLTYLSRQALLDLANVVGELADEAVPGAVIEAGCALGGSAIVLAAAKQPEVPLTIYDIFGQIPPPTEHDGDDVSERYEVIRSGRSEGLAGDRYYGYEPQLLDRVKRSFVQFGFDPHANMIDFVPGLYEDTLRPTGPVRMAHIDCDWYSSVATCLERIHPWLSEGGVMIVDDYDHWSGCRRAVDEFVERHPGYRPRHRERLHLVRSGR